MRQEAEAPDGQERPLHRLQRLSRLHVHARTSPTRTRTPSTRRSSRSTMCEECGSPMKLRPEPRGLGVPGLHGVPEVPQHRQRRRWPAERPRPGPTSRPGQICPECGHPLVRRHGRFGAYVVVLELPGLQVQAAQAGQGHGRAVSQGRRRHRRAARPVPAVLRLRQLPGLRLLALRAARSRRRARSAATRTCSCASARAGTSSPATRAAAASRNPRASSPK